MLTNEQIEAWWSRAANDHDGCFGAEVCWLADELLAARVEITRLNAARDQMQETAQRAERAHWSEIVKNAALKESLSWAIGNLMPAGDLCAWCSGNLEPGLGAFIEHFDVCPWHKARSSSPHVKNDQIITLCNELLAARRKAEEATVAKLEARAEAVALRTEIAGHVADLSFQGRRCGELSKALAWALSRAGYTIQARACVGYDESEGLAKAMKLLEEKPCP